MDNHKYPLKKKVVSVVSGRYEAGQKPLSWDDRVSGIDTVIDSEGNELKLFSTGDQSTPAPTWEILLTSEAPEGASNWTLYAIPKS